MPEGPEAEIARRQLERWTVGQRVMSFALLDEGCVRHRISTHAKDIYPEARDWLQQRLVGNAPSQVMRHGKRLAWCWEESGLVLHLGMTGQWIRCNSLADLRHVRVAFRMEEGHWVCFVDTRRFGCLVPLEGATTTALSQNLGPDALTSTFTGELLSSCFSGRRPIKVALMDQACLAGLGNIHAVELLWLARIHPEKPVQAVSVEQWARLAAAMPEHLNRVVEAQDGDKLVYITQGGENIFSVYGHEGAICSRCSGKIENKNIQGRSTFFCQNCQVL